MNITKLVRKQIIEMQEINWGDIPDDNGMRLLWGENQQLLSIYKKAIKQEIEKVNLYPSPTKKSLKDELARYNTVPIESIIPTNGSDEALELIAKVFLTEDDEVIIPLPSYPCFESVSKMMGAKVVSVPLNKNFSLDVEKLLKKVTPQTKIIWIANPNNPTGNLLLTEKQIEYILSRIDCLLILDECYFELAGVTGALFTSRYPNCIVVRSFSKVFALAGARLGYLACNPEAAVYLNKLQQTNQVFCVNRFALAAATAILRQPQLIFDSVKNFQELKNLFEEKIQRISGLTVWETKTTFSIIEILTKITAAQLKEQLQKQNIFIKDCSIYTGFGKQFFYLGIPKKEYQQTVVDKIKRIVMEE